MRGTLAHHRLGAAKTIAAMALVATATVGMVPAASATTHIVPGSFEVGVGVEGYFFLSDEANRRHTVGYRVGLGYNVTDMIGVELSADFAPREVNSDALYTFQLNVIVHPMVHEWVVPFVGVGPSFTFIDPAGDAAMDNDPGLNLIGGVKFFPWEYVGLRVDLRYLARFGTSDGEETSHDLMAGGGVFATFGGERETEPVLLDTDGDGFLDNEDACPTVPGVGSAAGCPDADGDTIADADDKCPENPGPKEYDGCPDTDGDGLIDIVDKCPQKPGPKEFDGCPDTDGDKIADLDDRCPRIPGEKAFQGCPPPPPIEIIQKFTGRIEGITFKVASAEIRESSFPTLDEAVAVLAKYPQIMVAIEGHTSSEGEYDYNVQLSKRRAESVKKYMVDKGIAADRLETAGYGPDRPIASNDDEAGRKQNRRIEFKILRQ